MIKFTQDLDRHYPKLSIGNLDIWFDKHGDLFSVDHYEAELVEGEYDFYIKVGDAIIHVPDIIKEAERQIVDILIDHRQAVIDEETYVENVKNMQGRL